LEHLRVGFHIEGSAPLDLKGAAASSEAHKETLVRMYRFVSWPIVPVVLSLSALELPA
jgi:hypothetical protein